MHALKFPSGDVGFCPDIRRALAALRELSLGSDAEHAL